MGKNRELAMSIFASAAIIFGFLMVTGTFFTGYHLTDDHEFLVIREQIKNMGILHAIIDTVRNDLTIRFRPVYQVFRVLGVAVIGLRWKIWYLVKAFEMVAAMTALYWFARRMRSNPLIAAMFTCISMCGMQAEIWCRLGPQESFGLLLFAIIILLETYPYSKRRNLVLTVLIFLMAGMKEAFILTIPAICLFVAWHGLWLEGKEFTLREIYSKIKENRGYIIVSALICAMDLAVIVLYVGTNEIGYAGIAPEMSWKDYIWTFLRFFGHDDQIIVYYGWILVMTVWTLVCADYKRIRNEWRKYLYAFLILVFAIGMQIVLHIKSGMRDRYLIPWIIGVCCYIFLLCFKILRDKKGIRLGFQILGIVMCSLALSWTPKQLLKFVETGDSTDFVISTIERECSEGDLVVTCLGEGELDLGIARYFRYEDENRAIYCQNISAPATASDHFFEEKGDILLESAKFLISSNTDEAEKELFEKSGLNQENYEKSSLKRYAIYKKISEKN